jgi:hypothetical protein
LIPINLGRELVNLLLDVSVRVSLEEVHSYRHHWEVSGQLLGTLGKDNEDVVSAIIDEVLENLVKTCKFQRDLN